MGHAPAKKKKFFLATIYFEYRLYIHNSLVRYLYLTVSFRPGEHITTCLALTSSVSLCVRSTEEGGTLAEDSLQCLRALSCSPEGIQYLLKYQSLQALVQAYLVQNEGKEKRSIHSASHCYSVSEEAKDVLVGTLGNLCLMNSELHLPTIFDVVTILSREFKSNQASPRVSIKRELENP